MKPSPRSHARSLCLAALIGMILVACGSDTGSNASPGTERGPCYPNGTCNRGLSCFSDLCVKGGTSTAAPAGMWGGDGGFMGAGGFTNTGGSMSAGGFTGTASVAGSGGAGAPASCGNGMLNPGEDCDGVVPVTATCEQLTMGARPAGGITCLGCRFDLSACSTSTGAGGFMGGAGGACPASCLDGSAGCPAGCNFGNVGTGGTTSGADAAADGQ